MADGEIAGRLIVPVTSNTRGFGKRLKRKIEEQTAGLAVKVGVEADAKGLRADLEKKAKKASKGVTAKIGVEVDAKGVAAKVKAVAEAAEAKIRLDVDASGVAEEVTKEKAKAEAAAGKKPIRVPIKTRAGLWLDALREKWLAQAAVSKKPIEVPMRVRMPRGRTLLRGTFIIGLVSLIQPALGAIAQLVGGLTAMAGALGPSVGVLAAAPIGITALIQGFLGATIASQGLGTAIGALNEKQKALAAGTEWTAEQQAELNKQMQNLSPSAQKVARRLVGLRGEWSAMRKRIQEPLFEPIADQIKPLAEVLLPSLEKGLRATSRALGATAGRAMEWMQTPLFNRNLTGVMRQNAGSIEAGGDALRYFFAGYLEFQRAAAPFQRDFDAWMTRTGRWFNDTMRENRLDGSTAAFLDKAIERATLLWDITKEFGGGLAGIFRAGDASGMRLLTTFDGFLTRWHSWVDSAAGQNYLSEWFADLETGFTESAKLINDAFKGIAKWAADPQIARMLNMIRTEMGPAVAELLETLGNLMGENVIGIITEISRALNNMAPAIEVVSQVTGAVVGLAGALNTLVEDSGAVGSSLASIVGGLLALKAASKFLGGGKKGGGLFGGLKGLAAGAAGAAAGGAATKGAAKGAARGAAMKAASAAGLGAAAGAATKGAAKNMDKTTRAAGRLRSALSSPVAKKAGVIGVVIEGISLANKFERAWHDYSGAASGISDGIRRDGTNAGKGIAAIRKEFDEGRIAKHAEDLGIDMDRLAESMAKGGREGDYYQQTMKRLNDEFSTSNFQNGKNVPFWDSQSEKIHETRTDLEKLVTTVESAKRRVSSKGSFDIGGMFGKAFNTAAADVQKLNQQIKGLPAGVQTQIRTPGVVESVYNVRTLQQQYKLTPKQVMTTLRASGVVKTIADVREAQRTFKLTPKQVVTLVKTNGIKPTLSEVAGLQRQYDLTRRDVVTLLKTTGKDFALGQALQLKRQYDLTGQDVITLLRANDQASGTINHVRGILAGLDGKTATTFITTVHRQVTSKLSNMGRTPQSNAEGGPIEGPGTGTSDSILSWLSNGEYVVKAAAVKKYGVGLLRRINAMRYASGGQAGKKADRDDDGGSTLNVKASKKSLKKLGQWISGAFANGIKGSAKAVEKAQREIFRRLTKTSKSRGWIRSFEKQTRREFARLENLARRKSAVSGRLKAAQERRTEALDFRRGFQDAGEESGSLTGIAGNNDGFLTPKFAMSELRRKIEDTQAFKRALSTLRKRGLGQRAYKQLAEAGVEEGGLVAQQLLAAAPEQLRELSRLQTRLASVADGVGASVQKELAGAGTNASKGFINGLKSQTKALRKAANGMASTFVKQIKKRLRIKSPSRVTEGLGIDSVDGMTVGVLKRQPRLNKAAQRISADLARNMAGSTHARSLYSATRKGAAANSSAAAAALAPLVGELVINGQSQGEIRDGLEEAMHALRRIRQGGVHADRTA